MKGVIKTILGSVIFIIFLALEVRAGNLLDPALLEGLDMQGVDSAMTPIGLIPYTQEISDKWNQVISKRHGRSLPMIFQVKRWTKPPSSENLGGVDPHSFMTALAEQTLLTPSLVKVFSNPQSYLKPGWDISKVRAIYLVPADIEGEAAFKIPYIHQHRRIGKEGKERIEYSFYLPEELSELELIKMMHDLQRKADGEDVGDFSLYEGLVELPEQVTREANDNLDGTDEKADCPAISKLWEKVLIEIPDATDEELEDPRRREEINKKWEQQRKTWSQLAEIGSDEVAKRLRSIIFSSASFQVRTNAFQAFVSILENRQDTEGLLGLLEQGILDPVLASQAYFEFGRVWDDKEDTRVRVEAIVAGQLRGQATYYPISFFLTRPGTMPSNQLRAISAIDHDVVDDDRNQEKGVLQNLLLLEVEKRLDEDGRNRELRKKVIVSTSSSPTPDNLYFINQALPVIARHLHLVGDRHILQRLSTSLSTSSYVPDDYKAKFKERIKQLIEAEKASLDQEVQKSLDD